jgi:hypothetical protein
MTVAAILLICSLFFSIAAAAEAEKDQWQFNITPYLWLPSVDGTFKFGPPPGWDGGPEVEIDSSDLLDDLNMAFMFTGEVRKGRWSVLTDVMYLDVSGQSSKIKSVDDTDRIPVSATIDAGTETTLKGAAWALAGSYDVWQGKAGSLGLLGGFRYFGLKATTDWNLTATVTGSDGVSQVFPRSGNITESEDIWDGIIGLRGRLNLGGSRFYVPYYLDIGTGTSELTWQGMVGLGYGFKWVDILVAYRYLYYDMDDDKLVQDMSLGGPEFGLKFKF